MRPPHRIVIVDVETTGLDPAIHQITEIAWRTYPDGVTQSVIPPHSLDNADRDALEISGYHARIAGKPAGSVEELTHLWEQLGGDGTTTTLAGFNPRFDSGFLAALFSRLELPDPEPWRRRLLDVAVYAYAFLPFPPGHVPSLAESAAACGIHNPAPHAAAWDVDTTHAVLRHLDTVRRSLPLEDRQ